MTALLDGVALDALAPGGPASWPRPALDALAPDGRSAFDDLHALGEVAEFPIRGLSLPELVAALSSVPVADVSGAVLVDAVAGWAQVIAMAQAAQAVAVRELGARTPDGLARVPDELACAMVCTRRAAQDLFLRSVHSAHHPSWPMRGRRVRSMRARWT